MRNKLTSKQFADHVNSGNWECAKASDVVPGKGDICNDYNRILCSGEDIFNYMGNKDNIPWFTFTESNVNWNIIEMTS